MVDKCGYHRREISDNSNTNHPSFSSTLLDEIYRSFDQGEDENINVIMRKKQQTSAAMFRSEEEIANFQRACMIEKWMEKKVREKDAARRKSTAAESVLRSSSWDSSGGGAGFLSESFYEKRPKSIRVCDSSLNKEKSASKNKDGFMKTKSRALKLYAELKKVKQPISPGARLAGFLNSLFTAAGNTKKPKMSNSETNSPILKSANASTCSSASSFSRSCLSKTPSSRGKSAGGEKRSVRFSPVIVNEDFQSCGHKSLQEEINVNCKKQNSEAINEEMMVQVNVKENNRRVEEAVRDFLRNYQKNEFRFDHRTKSHNLDQEYDDEDDDAASYASSDLFELDNLSAIGMERYREELPVYETTHLHTNRAISSGLIL
ncbi:protein BIG GRAIN 1-like B [Primulina eburnea]|uniref:protein BIG GRAIN 1-like B n=1 Tax=Primulina eburnea TaxID=1245227 RepID=UPI003C6CB0AB